MLRRTVIVTGGAGFLGSHLCEHLMRDDYAVVCVDYFYTGTKEYIVHLLDDPYFEFVRHDITFPLYVEADAIYNLAWPRCRWNVSPSGRRPRTRYAAPTCCHG